MPILQHRCNHFEKRIVISEDKSKVVSLVEFQIFGVCSWLGEKLGIKATSIRVYFIYLSFFTFGSPIIVYLISSFILEHKDYFKPTVQPKRKSVWDL
ncbi:MAG: PspC domain-containing protein [Flavobacteriales bacterium]|nr:PspC domain-containing protein [Flavobacteriales bacterium]